MTRRKIRIRPAPDEGCHPIDDPWPKALLRPETAEFLEYVSGETGQSATQLIADAVAGHYAHYRRRWTTGRGRDQDALDQALEPARGAHEQT